MKNEKSITPSTELQIEWCFKVSAQEDFSFKVKGDMLTIAARGLERNFENSMVLGLGQVRLLWPAMIDPALQCVDRQYHMSLIDALAFIFMAIEQIRGDGVGAQTVNFLMDKSSSLEQ